MKNALLILIACVLAPPGCREEVGGYGQDCFGTGDCNQGLVCFIYGSGNTCYEAGTDGERCWQWTRRCNSGLVCGEEARCCADGGSSGHFVFSNSIFGLGNGRNFIVADFNKDDLADVAVLGQDRTSGMYGVSTVLWDLQSPVLWRGEGQLSPDSTRSLGPDPTDIASGDFNRDQVVDLAVVTESTDTLYVLLGNGDGSFADPAEYPTSEMPIGVAVADIDADGIQDIAVAAKERPTCVFLGNGDGTFQAKLDGPGGHHQGASPLATITAGQLDGDPSDELVITGGGGSAYAAVLDWDGAGPALAAGDAVELGPEGRYYHMTGGDFNDDGTLDVAVISREDSKLFVLLGAGDGTLGTPGEIEVCAMPMMISAGDLDGDDNTDLFIACGGLNEISYLPGNGDGTFAPQIRHPIPQDDTNGPEAVRAGDFNQDGIADIMIQHNFGHLQMMLGVGRCGI